MERYLGVNSMRKSLRGHGSKSGKEKAGHQGQLRSLSYKENCMREKERVGSGGERTAYIQFKE